MHANVSLTFQIHVAFASIWVTLDQTTFVHLTEPWYEVGIHFLVPRPRRTTSFWALTKPFPNEIWFLLVTVLLLHSSYTYVRAWIDPDFPKRRLDVFFSYGTVTRAIWSWPEQIFRHVYFRIPKLPNHPYWFNWSSAKQFGTKNCFH